MKKDSPIKISRDNCSARLFHACKRLEIETVDDLSKREIMDLKHERGFGIKTIMEARQLLVSSGLDFPCPDRPLFNFEMVVFLKTPTKIKPCNSIDPRGKIVVLYHPGSQELAGFLNKNKSQSNSPFLFKDKASAKIAMSTHRKFARSLQATFDYKITSVTYEK